MRHFLDTWDWSVDELKNMIDLAFLLKRLDKQGACPELLKGVSLGMIFAEQSTRTRVSFEVALEKLGGHALYLRPGEIHLGTGYEGSYDTAKVLSRFLDCVLIRDLDHDSVMSYAKYSDVPVINAMTAYLHPCQAMCDLMTVMEQKPKDKDLKDITLFWVGPTDVEETGANAVSQLFPRLGMSVIYASPEGYTLTDKEAEPSMRAAEEGMGRFIRTTEPEKYIGEADFVYTGCLYYPGYFEEQKEERMQLFIPRYHVNMDLMKKAQPHAKFMHYLPALRDVDVTSEVMDSDYSIVFDQAENRLYSEMAILCTLLYPGLKQASEDLKRHGKAEAEALLSRCLS